MIKREYRCFFEGQQEKMYFDHLARIVKNVNPNIILKFREMEKLLSLEKSSTNVNKIAVFDYDMNKVEFEKKIKICKKTAILYSNLNFDLWLLLHKEAFNKSVQNNKAYADLIKSKYGLSEKANIKAKGSMEKILGQIEIDDIKRAIQNSENIINSKIESEKIFVKKGFYYYDNPSMNINEFLKKLFKEIRI